jgi:hypothetical protein
MNAPHPPRRQSVGEVLTEGWHLTVAGWIKVFPWILAAEIIGSLQIAGAGGGLLNTDLSLLTQPAYLGWVVFSAFMQALLYAYAVLRLAQLDKVRIAAPIRAAFSAMPTVLIAYVIYELLVVFGLGMALMLLSLIALLFGVIPGLIVALIPLVPTAWVSTALAFFAYPAVLEQQGPFASLGRSFRLAKSNWGHAALVVSVPAIGLLCVAVLQDLVPALHSLHSLMRSMSQLSSQPTTAQLQDMLSNPGTQPTTDKHPLWHAITVLLSACAWWYAVAVCYAEFKMLKQSGSFTTR